MIDVIGAPARELARSRSASRVGALAAQAGLFQFHFEHRVHLDLPESWVPEHQLELADPPTWREGILPERKYQSFRHDLLIGSFHPQHRGKWSAHELCHGLVGFAYAPGATPMFHATAARLAELLPVALWYWFDEADRRRCLLHQGGGALFRTYCRECDLTDGRAPLDPSMIEQGRAFMAAELRAIAKTVESGVLVSHRFATLDLASDGVAYASAHGPRLASPGFAAWMERFAVRGGGWSDSLELLETRVMSVAEALLTDSNPTPLAPSPEHGRWRWILQDIAWRIEVVRSQCAGEAAAELLALLDVLAEATPATIDEGRDARTEVLGVLAQAVEGYTELDERFELPSPNELFAVGYAVEDGAPWTGGSAAQLAEGLRTSAPASLAMAGVCAEEVLQDIVSRDRTAPRREALTDRWAESLSQVLGPADSRSQLGRYEAAVAVAPTRVTPPLPGAARNRRWKLVPGARVELFSFDVAAMASEVIAGALPREVEGGIAVVVTRSPSGDALVAEVDPGVAEMLRSLGPGGELPLTADVIAELQNIGVITPAAYVV